MTHESFKQILDWSDSYTKEQICKFLDDSFVCPILEKWFELWKQGKQRQIFDEIESVDQLRRNIASNYPERIPKDAEKPRVKQNNNSGRVEK